jgi:hypothetical protein
MSTPDPLMTAYISGLDLVSVQMGVTAAGAEIGRTPLTGVPPTQSVILYCKRHSNIERMIESVRSEFAKIPTRATLSVAISTVLNSAATFGINILTETEVRIMASEAVVQMEAELAQLQLVGGLSAINRSAQNDAAAAKAVISAWHAAIFSWLDSLGSFMRGSGKGHWLVDLAILHRVSLASMSTNWAIIGPRLAAIICQLDEGISKLVILGERLTVGLLHHWSECTGRRRTKGTKRVVPRR